MLTPLILFLGLTIATAVIAHWSDNLGKKLGKKRVSLLGLRPRTTATILTVASSWGIMIFTLVVLLVAVAPLRRALFFYDRDVAKAQSDLSIADAQTEAARKQLKATQTQYDAANGQLGAARGQLERATKAITVSQRAARDSARRADAARGRTANAERDAAQAQARVVAAQSRFARAQSLLLAAQKQQVEAERSEASALAEKSGAEAQTRRAQNQGNAARAATKVALSNRDAARASLRTANLALSRSKSQLNASSRQLLATEQQLSTTAKQLSVTSQQLQQKKLETLVFAASDAPIKVKQTFAARTISANQSADVLVRQLRELLQQGRQAFAESEDLAPTPNFPPTTTLQILSLEATDDKGKPVLLEGERLLQRLALDIRSQRLADLISVRLLAARNYLAGEKRIEVIFEFVPIKPAFYAGDVLASATIDGAQEDWRIFRSLDDLLTLGQQRAQNVGVNPPFSPDQPKFYASGTNVRIFAALRAIEASKKRLQVNLVTFKALSTVEPLQVRFEIEGLGAPDAPVVPAATPRATVVPTS